MLRHLTLLLSGLLFGLGLSISGLINPQKVLNFLNVTGPWDPSLIFTMGGAVIISGLANYFILKQPTPFLSSSFDLPTKRDIDFKLIFGAIIFGTGWGLVGFCPGPAVAATAYLEPEVGLFVICMLGGMLLRKLFQR